MPNDRRIVTVDYLEEYAAGLNIPSVDQTYLSTSENAQSGKAVAGALSGYVAAEVGKGLSSNDFTNMDKEKLDSALQKEDIDQTYSPSSENAQSGKAVAAAINSIPNPSWHNIETITTTEALGTITRRFGALNGEITYPAAAKVNKIQAYITIPPNAEATSTRLECRISNKNSTRIFMWEYISTTDTKIGWILLERHAKWTPVFTASQTKSESLPNSIVVQTYTCSADNLMMMGTENVRYLSFYGRLPAGTVIDIWGYYDED